MKKACVWGLLALMILGISSLSTAQEGDGPAPFLYRFSPRHDAYIIERADGSEPRFFAQGLIPPDDFAATGAGWSPSGNWFSWASFQYIVYSNWTTTLGVVDVSGEKSLSVGSDFQNLFFSRWSPVEDLLFAVDYDYTRASALHDAYLIDPAQDAIIANLLGDPEAFNVHYTSPVWHPGGEFVVLHISEQIYDAQNNSTKRERIVIINRDGNITEREGRLTNRGVQMVSNEGRILYQRNDGTFVVEHVVTGETWDVAALSGKFVESMWNPTHELILLTTCDNCFQNDRVFFTWLVNPITREVSRLPYDIPWPYHQ